MKIKNNQNKKKFLFFRIFLCYTFYKRRILVIKRMSYKQGDEMQKKFIHNNEEQYNSFSTTREEKKQNSFFQPADLKWESNRQQKKEESFKQSLEHFSHGAKVSQEEKSNVQAKNTFFIRGFEGIRLLSLLCVLFYHWFPQTLKGGYLGVVAFFTLSGYLTTSGFFREFLETGKIKIFSFYKRRFIRLYPSLIFLLLTMSTWIFFFQPQVLYNFRNGFISSLLGYNNWWQIFSNLSYFEQHTQINLFTHLWTLAVEVQFYLFWPWMLWLVLRGKKEKEARKTLRLTTLGLAVFSLLWTLFMLLGTQVDLNRVYLGTDTRLFSFFLGAFWAVFMPLSRIKVWLKQFSKLLLDQVAGVLFLFLVSFVVFLSGTGSLLTYLGIFVWNFLLLIFMTLVAEPFTFLGSVFGSPVVRSLAKRSFAMYLWHYPILGLSQYAYQIFDVAYSAKILVQFFFMLLMAEISYQICERFFVSLWFYGTTQVAEMKEQLRKGQMLKGENVSILKKQKIGLGKVVLRTLSILCIFVLSFATVMALLKDTGTLPDDIVELKKQLEANLSLPDSLPQESLQTSESTSTSESSASSTNEGLTPAVTTESSAASTSASTETSEEMDNFSEDIMKNETYLQKLEQFLPAKFDRTKGVENFEYVVSKVPTLELDVLQRHLAINLPVVIVGDSVLLGSKGEVQALLPNALVNADVSRQWAAGAQVVHQLAAENKLPKVIVMALGTNGVISAEQVNQFAETYKDHYVFLVNTVVNNQSEGIANTAINDALARQPNTFLIDWHSLAKTKASWFASDFVHPSVEGRKIYAQLIAERVLSYLIEEAEQNAR